MEFAHIRWQNCAVSHLGIEIVEAGDDYLTARISVDERIRQPVGILHGGVSAVLAEIWHRAALSSLWTVPGSIVLGSPLMPAI